MANPRTRRKRKAKQGPQKRKGRRLPRALAQSEAEALVAQVNPKSTTGLRNRAMLAAMLRAGLRVTEVVKLMPADIDFDAGTIRVLGKGDSERVVPIGGGTLGWFVAWAERRDKLGLRTTPFFCRIRRSGIAGEPLERGQEITQANVQALVRRLGEKAGIAQRVTPHTLRHTYATWLRERGYDILEIQQLLGHRNVSTTMIYAHVNPVALREKIRATEADEVEAPEPTMAELVAEVRALREKLGR